MQNVSNPSRRSLFKHFASALCSFAATDAEAPPPAPHDASYQIADRRELADGGVGLFIVVAASTSSDDLRMLGERLREHFRSEPNVVAVVFDDADAAKAVRAGSRIVGEERFAAAKAHQRASYTKYSRTGKESLTIFGPNPEIVTF